MLIDSNGTFLVKPVVAGVAADSFIVYVSGTAGGCVLKLQYQNEGGTYIDLEDGTLVVSSENLVNAGRGAYIFITVTGATGATAVYVTARGLS